MQNIKDNRHTNENELLLKYKCGVDQGHHADSPSCKEVQKVCLQVYFGSCRQAIKYHPQNTATDRGTLKLE